MRLKAYTALGSLAILSAGVLVKANPASAASLVEVGTIEISGLLDATSLGTTPNFPEPIPGFPAPVTTFDFSAIGASSPDPTGSPNTGEFQFTGGSGIFEDPENPPLVFGGQIKDLPDDATGLFEPVDDFLTFSGIVLDTDPSVDTSTFDTTFDLAGITAVNYNDTGLGVGIVFSLEGSFDTPEVGVVQGEGTISADITYSDFAEFGNFEEFITFASTPGNVIEGISYSGNFVAFEQEAVPEPSSVVSLVTLGLIGTGFLAGKKKQNKIG